MLFLPLVIRDSYKIMIRILHTADWHLGQTFFGYDRTEEHGVFLNWLAEEIRQKEIERQFLWRKQYPLLLYYRAE